MTHLIQRILGVAISGLCLFSASAAYADRPDYIRLRSLVYAGSGCPAGSVAGNVSPDAEAFTLLFDQYIAQVGPGVPFREKRKNCQLNLDFEYPQGWSFAIFSVDTRGYVALERGVKGTQQTSQYYSGSANTTVFKTSFQGPEDRNYHIRDTLSIGSLNWSPCGAQRALNLNTQINLDNSANANRNGLLTVDSIDGDFTIQYHLQWQRCR